VYRQGWVYGQGGGWTDRGAGVYGQAGGVHGEVRGGAGPGGGAPLGTCWSARSGAPAPTPAARGPARWWTRSAWGARRSARPWPGRSESWPCSGASTRGSCSSGRFFLAPGTPPAHPAPAAAQPQQQPQPQQWIQHQIQWGVPRDFLCRGWGGVPGGLPRVGRAREQGLVRIVMEKCGGGDLYNAIATRGGCLRAPRGTCSARWRRLSRSAIPGGDTPRHQAREHLLHLPPGLPSPTPPPSPASRPLGDATCPGQAGDLGSHS